MKIKEVMHQPVKCCDSTMSLDQVASQMWNDDLGIIPITDREQKVIGVVTDRDITMAATLKHKPLWEISAGELIAGKPCHYCQPGDDIHKVLDLMASSRIRRVPVVDEHQHIAGMVGFKDLAEHMATASRGKKVDLSSIEVLGTFRKICRPNELQAST
jgi:CBS domain-containing protein